MNSAQPSDLVFAAFNARYAHTSFGARYLFANLGDLQERAELLEFDLQIQPRVAAEKILAGNPVIVSMGCYIWNIDLVTQVAALLKSIRPDITLILGGPEISYETEEQDIFQYADHVICGEGESEFPKLCRQLLRPAGFQQAAESRQDVGETPAPSASGGPFERTGFNPYQDVEQTQRKNLPHWTQEGCTYFVTFRLADSIAQARIKEYEELRTKWKEHHHPPYSEEERARCNELFSERVNEWLDEGAGSCYLQEPELSQIVADTLTHFDGDRYELDEWVVMPNHVHVLVKPLGECHLADILHSWKSFSANLINRKLGNTGSLWKKEYYDHIVRDPEELMRIRKYILNNPAKAGISAACSPAHTVDILAASGGPLEAGGTSVPPSSSRPPSRPPRIIKSAPVDVTAIALPYDFYTDEDIAHRALYVEASRGCPFRCEYCMSSLDACVRYFPEEKLFPAFQRLFDRGARKFKFVDRTFNIDIAFALKVLAFFKERYEPGMMLHFEVIPDHLPDALMDAVRACPPGMLQFEIGIQTFNEAVAHRIQRPLNIEKIEVNLRRLRNETGVHIHSDLIAGLPGEDLNSFETGFNRLLALHPQEIQLGILKRLRGAPIARHTREWNMVYSPHAPYEILSTSLIPFEDMQRVQRFARYWNLTVNNGRFINTAPLIWKDAPSPFAAFLIWSDWLYAKTNTTGNLHLVRLAKLLMEFLTEERRFNERSVAEVLWQDYSRGNRPDMPGFLKKFRFEPSSGKAGDSLAALPRQARHQADPPGRMDR